jgi:LacI family repressor for deo operon, udp, cdd, tsx, nupC, and nupG
MRIYSKLPRQPLAGYTLGMSIVAVAKRAGVSVATVSRVLNESTSVRAETSKQVQSAMRELGYKPPKVRRGPKRGSRRIVQSAFAKRQVAVLTVGAFQQWLGLPVMASVVAGVMRACKEQDVRAILDEMPDPEVPTQIVQRREVDAALVFFMSGLDPQHLVRLSRQIPLVWVMGSEDVPVDVDHVSADNCGAGQLALRYLADHRCQNLAFISDQPSWAFIRLRAQAFANAASDEGKVVRHYLVGSEKTSLHPYGENVCRRASLDELVEAMAIADPKPDGLFVPTDLLSTQIYPLLQKHQLAPEKRLRIISCDNEEQRLSMLRPRPASIDIRGESIGRAAVRQLIQRMSRPDEPRVRLQVSPMLPGSM